MSGLKNLILVVNICIILKMSAETAWKLNFFLESIACLEACFKRVFDAKVFLVKNLDKLKIIEDF